MKCYARIQYPNFRTCARCGESTKALNYRNDNSAPLCDECMRALGDFGLCKYLLRVPYEISRKIWDDIGCRPYSAWYLYGSTTGSDTKLMEADACIPWSHDHLGRPRFDAKGCMKQVLAQRSECLGTIVSVPNLKLPPTPGNLSTLKLVNSPLVCLMDCDERGVTWGRMVSGSAEEDVIVVLEEES